MIKKQSKLLTGLVLAMITSVSQATSLDSCYIGEVFQFAGSFAPLGTAFTDGSLLPISGNEALFTIIGTTYGGDGQTTFALPDLRGREAIGTGQGVGLTNNVTLGQQRGSQSVPLSASGSATVIPSTRPATSTAVTAGSATVATIPPQLGSNYVICVEGIFPTQN